jgi:hypothetical protein
MRIVRTSTLLALFAAITAAAASMPTGHPAMAEGMMKMCPMEDMEFCVRGKDGSKHTEWTNPCFAKQSGMHILHKGACKGMGMGMGMH